MSTAPTYKNFDSIVPVHFLDPNNKVDFIGENRSTLQELDLLTYNINKSANDSFIKNYTVNNLIKDTNSKEIFNYRNEIGIQDLNTKLNFKTTQSNLSSTFFLQALTTRDDSDCIITFNIDLSDANGEKFLVDFIDNDKCTVSLVDGKIPKFLYDNNSNALVFRFLTGGNDDNNYLFDYYYDENSNRLRLFKDNKIVTPVMTTIFTDVQVITTVGGEQQFTTVTLSSQINSIGLSSVNEQTLVNGTIGTERKTLLLNENNIDQFIHYDFEENYKLSNDTVSGIKYDFLTHYTYSNIVTANEQYNYPHVNLNFFNLKNHISSDNIVYSNGEENDNGNKEYRGREYQNFTNQKSKETDYDNITLNYNFFDKEYKIGSKDFTAFTLPDNLFPFKKLNINDTGLAKNGSFAANNPYFSDKVFKLADTNKNNIQNSFIEDEEFLVLENDVSLFVLQSGDLLGFQSIDDVQNNDIFGTYLCTWLKGDGLTKGTWYDRYYIPKNESYTISFSGQSNIFENTTQAAEFFETNQTNLIYYDLKSNLTFEPNASYVYQRINKKQINSYINSQKERLLKDTFTIQTSSVQLQNINEVNLNVNKGYDNLDIQPIPNRDFNIGFELELDTLSSLDSYQLFGNLYEDGFTLKNNFFFTPFIFIPQGNVLYIYDNNLNLLRSNTYESTANIIDVLYIEQNNNIVLVCDNKLIKTNYFGEVLYERSPQDAIYGNLINEVIKSYRSRTFYGFNNVLFFTNRYTENAPVLNLDLNNLIITENTVLNNQFFNDTLSATYNSIVPDNGGYRFLVGSVPKKLNDQVACSLQNVNRFISTQFIPGEAFLSTSLSATLSGGIIAGRSFDENEYTTISQLSSVAGPTYQQFFTFIQTGRSRIIFDRLETDQFNDPILDTTNSKIFDINSIENRLFVQYFDLSANKGFIQEFTPERFKLSAYELSEEASEGYKLDFIEEDKQLKLLSFSRNLSSNIVVDKINVNTGAIEKTALLPITGIDITEQTVYVANENIPSSIFSSSSSLSSIYPTGLYENRRITSLAYNDIINFNSSLSADFDKLSSNLTHINLTNYYSLDQKYNTLRNKLVFKFNLSSILGEEIISEEWNKAGPPLSANGYTSFTWSNPALSLSGWDGELNLLTSEDISNVEILFTIPNLDIKNYINLDFNLNKGVIKIYNNGLFIGNIAFNPNIISIDKLLYPELFINTQNIRNIPIDEIVSDINYNSKGGILKELKIHNTSFDNSLINYLELQTKSIDPLYFRVPCATRNKTEEIDTLFDYNIPGNISNYLKVNITGVNISNETKTQLKNYLENSVDVFTPSQQKLIYNVE